MPIVLMIDAESPEEAQKAVEDWSEEIDMNDALPTGTEDIDVAPPLEHNDEGQRILYLPVFEDFSDEETFDDEEDDFNDGDPDF